MTPRRLYTRGRLLVCVWIAALICSAGAVSCGSQKAASPPAGIAGSAGVSTAYYANQLNTFSDYWALAGEGSEVKFLLTANSTRHDFPFHDTRCAFQNTSLYPYHLQFLRTFESFSELDAEGYAALVLRSGRELWGGSLKIFAATPHPTTGQLGVVAFTAYLDIADDGQWLLAVSTVANLLNACTPFANGALAYWPSGTAEAVRSRRLSDVLSSMGVAVLDPDRVQPGLSAEGYSQGESYGYLNIAVPGGNPDAFGALDIVLTEAAPNELNLVSGLLTARPQSIASHTNLRLREKATPNAYVPGILENQIVLSLRNSLVHLTVQGNDVKLEPASLDVAQSFWSRARPTLATTAVDLNASRWKGLSELSSADGAAYGSKAASLGELHRVLPAPNRFDGFAIPFSAYQQFMQETALDGRVAAFLADPEFHSNAALKRAELAELRRLIATTPLPPASQQSLVDAVNEHFGAQGTSVRLRFRSSANTEDVLGASGAGVHDSRSGCLGDDLDDDDLGPSVCLTQEMAQYFTGELASKRAELSEHPERTWLRSDIKDLERELTEEKSAQGALRVVWASLWNERAYDDRVYYAFDSRQAFMGVAVHPALVGELVESVAFTNVHGAEAAPLFRIVSQAGEVGVVRPSNPLVEPEVLTFRYDNQGPPFEVELVSPSTLAPGGLSLWSEGRLTELATLLYRVHVHFAQNVYQNWAPVSLDVELDVANDGTIVFKQVRPYQP